MSLVEAGYSQRGGLEEWLGELADRSHALLDAGMGVAVMTFESGRGRLETGHVVARGPGAEVLEANIRERQRNVTPVGIAHFLHGGTRAGTLSQEVFAAVPDERRGFERQGVGDVLGLIALTGDGAGVAISAPLEQERSLTSSEARWLGRVATHLGAGWRLRRALAGGSARAESAVFKPDGRLAEASTGLATTSEGQIRDAVLRAEEARAAGRRSSPDRALELWQGLVEGRWSLVDRFDDGGRRFVVAVQNRQSLGDPRGLSLREREVAEWIGLGQSDKEIAYTLGISGSAVANAAARARRKLEVASRAELAAFFAPGGLRARLVECEIAGESLVAGALRLVGHQGLAGLTDAEREVALLALAGHTNAEIGRRRESSARTVANQLQSVYRKLSVTTRAELAARLDQGPSPPEG